MLHTNAPTPMHLWSSSKSYHRLLSLCSCGRADVRTMSAADCGLLRTWVRNRRKGVKSITYMGLADRGVPDINNCTRVVTRHDEGVPTKKGVCAKMHLLRQLLLSRHAVMWQVLEFRISPLGPHISRRKKLLSLDHRRFFSCLLSRLIMQQTHQDAHRETAALLKQHRLEQPRKVWLACQSIGDILEIALAAIASWVVHRRTVTVKQAAADHTVSRRPGRPFPYSCRSYQSPRLLAKPVYYVLCLLCLLMIAKELPDSVPDTAVARISRNALVHPSADVTFVFLVVLIYLFFSFVSRRHSRDRLQCAVFVLAACVVALVSVLTDSDRHLVVLSFIPTAVSTSMAISLCCHSLWRSLSGAN